MTSSSLKLLAAERGCCWGGIVRGCKRLAAEEVGAVDVVLVFCPNCGDFSSRVRFSRKELFVRDELAERMEEDGEGTLK